jgi:hypothetical protein
MAVPMFLASTPFGWGHASPPSQPDDGGSSSPAAHSASGASDSSVKMHDGLPVSMSEPVLGSTTAPKSESRPGNVLVSMPPNPAVALVPVELVVTPSGVNMRLPTTVPLVSVDATTDPLPSWSGRSIFYTPEVMATPKRLQLEVISLCKLHGYRMQEALYPEEETRPSSVEYAELILIDEADRLKFLPLEQVRDIYDEPALASS